MILLKGQQRGRTYFITSPNNAQTPALPRSLRWITVPPVPTAPRNAPPLPGCSYQPLGHIPPIPTVYLPAATTTEPSDEPLALLERPSRLEPCLRVRSTQPARARPIAPTSGPRNDAANRRACRTRRAPS